MARNLALALIAALALLCTRASADAGGKMAKVRPARAQQRPNPRG